MGRAFEYRRASKEARWDKMSKLFPKLAKSITIAAKEGGIDPDMNPKLRTAIATAKAQNMPKDNIDAAIKRANGKDSSDIKVIHYDGKMPHGGLVIIECATDNATRTVANIKAIFNKNGGEFLPSGSLSYMFSRKAVFEVQNPNANLDELELALIDYGMSDIKAFDESLMIYGEYENFGNLSEGIEKLGLKFKKGYLAFVPNSTIEVNDAQYEDIEKLLDKLEDDDDVQAVFTNLE